MPRENPQRRRIRLAPAVYADIGEICSITVAVKGRTPVFASPAVVAAAVDVLRRHAAVTGVPVYAWCVMPDHVHLILGASLNCDLVTFVGQFKNLAQREAWRLGVKGAFWQTGFWDHFLRGDQRLAPAIEYVLNNPYGRGSSSDGATTGFLGRVRARGRRRGTSPRPTATAPYGLARSPCP
jgi:REP element-mobilizing transposase RayT